MKSISILSSLIFSISGFAASDRSFQEVKFYHCSKVNKKSCLQMTAPEGETSFNGKMMFLNKATLTYIQGEKTQSEVYDQAFVNFDTEQVIAIRHTDKQSIEDVYDFGRLEKKSYRRKL